VDGRCWVVLCVSCGQLLCLLRGRYFAFRLVLGMEDHLRGRGVRDLRLSDPVLSAERASVLRPSQRRDRVSDSACAAVNADCV